MKSMIEARRQGIRDERDGQGIDLSLLQVYCNKSQIEG